MPSVIQSVMSAGRYSSPVMLWRSFSSFMERLLSDVDLIERIGITFGKKLSEL